VRDGKKKRALKPHAIQQSNRTVKSAAVTDDGGLGQASCSTLARTLPLTTPAQEGGGRGRRMGPEKGESTGIQLAQLTLLQLHEWGRRGGGGCGLLDVLLRYTLPRYGGGEVVVAGWSQGVVTLCRWRFSPDGG
jgi:hypothetical protein